MGRISYPRTLGSNYYARIVNEIERRIDELLVQSVPSADELENIMVLVERIGFENLAPELKDKLLQILRKKLFPVITQRKHVEALRRQAAESARTLNKLSNTIISLALSLSQSSTLTVHQRLNSTGYFDFNALPTTGKYVDVYHTSDGLILAVIAESGGPTQKSIEENSTLYRQALNVAVPDQKETVLHSWDEGRFTSYNVAANAVTARDGGIHEPTRLAWMNLCDLIYTSVRQEAFKAYEMSVGTYRELKRESKPGYQREHFIPHSCFMERSRQAGERRAQVPIPSQYGRYTEADAITYWVYDGQTQHTEHRYLTDLEAAYAEQMHQEGRYATVREWLDYMEACTASAIQVETIERARDVFEARVAADDAVKIARALRNEYEAQLDRLGTDKEALLSNLIGGGDGPARELERIEDDF